MFLPIKQKPDTTFDYDSVVITVPNVLDTDTINRLVNFTKNSNSGLHRRGSKSASVQASFSTCLVPEVDDIYQMLDTVWEAHAHKIIKSLSFIELYEIKCYIEGDQFGSHHDSYGILNKEFDRKLNMVVQLSDSDSYEGGDLIIGRDKICNRDIGTAILFPAHYMHRVTKITRGTRYCLIGHAWGPYIR